MKRLTPKACAERSSSVTVMSEVEIVHTVGRTLQICYARLSARRGGCKNGSSSARHPFQQPTRRISDPHCNIHVQSRHLGVHNGANITGISTMAIARGARVYKHRLSSDSDLHSSFTLPTPSDCASESNANTTVSYAPGRTGRRGPCTPALR